MSARAVTRSSSRLTTSGSTSWANISRSSSNSWGAPPAAQYKRGKDCWAHVATKHMNWSTERSKHEWKQLAKEKPHLIIRKDWLKEDYEYLRRVIETVH